MDTVKAFAAEHNLTFPILLDADKTVVRQYGVRGIPNSIFIDREGIIRVRHFGPMSIEFLEETLNELL